MIIFKRVTDIQTFLQDQKQKKQEINFVPTMGALHNGHISLLNRSKSEKGITVSSIFINPTQFNDPNDFANYPQSIENDIYLLEKAGCDVLFLPSVKEMYPQGLQKSTAIHLGHLEEIFEGKFRPGHFQGVCQVVKRLLDIVNPDRLFLGQKDYQQCMVIKKMTGLLNYDIEIVICPTQREPDGLAMSSRNLRLTPENRKTAPEIFRVLSLMKKEIKAGTLQELKVKGTNLLSEKGLSVEYLEFAGAETLDPIDNWDGHSPLVILTAAYSGEIRLIDNLLITA